MKISGLLLASGLSTRITKFKPLLQFENKSFLITILNKLEIVVSEIVVVVGHNHDAIVEALEKRYDARAKQVMEAVWEINSNIRIVYNNNYKKGMFTSLQKGCELFVDNDWVFYHFVDQPTIPQEFYHKFVGTVDKSVDWIQPNYQSRNGHPILFNRKILDQILESENSLNLKQIRDNKEIIKKIWECNYPQILQDIDTDEDYRNLFQKS